MYHWNWLTDKIHLLNLSTIDDGNSTLHFILLLGHVLRQAVRVDVRHFIGKAFMLRPFNARDRFLHIRKSNLFADKFDGRKNFMMEAAFLVVVGLSGSGVSFRSVSNPRQFIRHNYNKLTVETNNPSAQFKKDASFNIRYVIDIYKDIFVFWNWNSGI